MGGFQALREREVVGATRCAHRQAACESYANLFSIPVIHQQLPGCRRRSLVMASDQQPGWDSIHAAASSARTRHRSGRGSSHAVPDGVPRRHHGPPAPAAAEQGDCYPRSSHGSNHLFANKTSILEASLTLGHSPS